MTRSVWRKRRTLKWAGLLLSILMLGLWVFGVMFAASYAPASNQWQERKMPFLSPCLFESTSAFPGV